MRFGLLLFFLMLPFGALAEEAVLSRQDGFVLLWTSLKRNVEETREKPFSDVPGDRSSAALLTYAKSRGILNDDPKFYPDAALHLSDALLWLLRSRNVAAPDDITYESLIGLMNRYALTQDAEGAFSENPTMTQASLQSVMTTLDTALRNELHTISFYAEEFEGDSTAFGEPFNPRDFTAAHRTLPHNTLVLVRHPESGKEVTIRINDRGPYVDGRDMDLSLTAFEVLAPRSQGVLTNVTFERLGSAVETSTCPDPVYFHRLGRTILSPGIPRIITPGTVLLLSADQSFRLLQMRAPGRAPVRSREWTRRGETLEVRFDQVGTYSFIFHEDAGQRRRFRTEVRKLRCDTAPKIPPALRS